MFEMNKLDDLIPKVSTPPRLDSSERVVKEIVAALKSSRDVVYDFITPASEMSGAKIAEIKKIQTLFWNKGYWTVLFTRNRDRHICQHHDEMHGAKCSMHLRVTIPEPKKEDDFINCNCDAYVFS